MTAALSEHGREPCARENRISHATGLSASSWPSQQPGSCRNGTAPFTHARMAQFLEAGEALVQFIARQVFGAPDWDTPIKFR